MSASRLGAGGLPRYSSCWRERAMRTPGIRQLVAGRIGERDGHPVGSRGKDPDQGLVVALDVARLKRRSEGDRPQHGDGATELRVDGGRERARDLDSGALGLPALLVEEREQRQAGRERQRKHAGTGEEQQPATQCAADHHGRAYLRRKALISSTLSCGSPAARSSAGWVPTTRFIQSMFSRIRATTAGHSRAVCRFGSGRTWHWLQARRNASPEGRK